jgi:hypothetical protein
MDGLRCAMRPKHQKPMVELADLGLAIVPVRQPMVSLESLVSLEPLVSLAPVEPAA